MLQQRTAGSCAPGVHPPAPLGSPRGAPLPSSPPPAASIARSWAIVPLLVGLAAAILGACGNGGGGGGSSDNVIVTISPATANVAAGATVQFTATVTGASNTAINWGASGGTITKDGLYTAPAIGGGYAVQATSAASSTSSATGVVYVTGEGSVLEPFYDSQHPYVQLMSPMPYATYFAPATIRMWAHAPDYGDDGVNNYSPHVDFFLGTTMVGSVSRTANDPIDYYEVEATGVAAGSYELYVRSRMASGTVESIHVPITVVDETSTGPAMPLASDIVLSGSANFEMIGTPTAHAVLSSANGSRIRSMPGWTGHLTIRNTDIIGLGSLDVPGIEVTVSGTSALEITDSVFDRCGPPALTANDKAPVTIRGNTFQPNILTPVSDEADYAGSHPSIVFSGDSTVTKTFQGNNVGVSFVRFDRSSHWLIGGDHDADSNVLLGVRAGLEFDDTTDITIRGNYSYHRYPFGWSQGHNLDFEGTNSSALVEHNVFRSSSWMIQDVPGDFRYNLLVDNINEAFFRSFGAAINIHHNVLVNTGFQRVYYPSAGVLFGDGAFYSNTIDMGGTQVGWSANPFIPSDSQHKLKSVRNNVFTGFAYDTATDVVAAGAATSADYNCFYNPDTTKLKRYGDTGFGGHDCGAGASTDPHFSQARVIPFPVSDGDVWRRRITVSQVLALYRGIYTPGTGSPLIDAGDPSDDKDGMRNTDIGAVGAGNAHPDDLFGHFGP
jgi:hypothetical protein